MEPSPFGVDKCGGGMVNIGVPLEPGRDSGVLKEGQIELSWFGVSIEGNGEDGVERDVIYTQ